MEELNGTMSITDFSDMNITVSSKMDHLLHSDTMILVAGLLLMIIVGLVFRSACLRLSSKNSRQELMRQGLRQIGANMDHVTKAMSNELHLPDSPKTVIRTYSKYKNKENGEDINCEQSLSLRVKALSNSLIKQEEEFRVTEEFGKNMSMELGNMNKGER